MNKKAILLTILLLNLPNTVFADIYKWTDKNGAVHFSNSPDSLSGDAQKIIENPDPVKPQIQIIPPSPKTYVPQIPEKTKEQREKELNEQIKRSKEESKKAIDGMFSIANAGLISIRNGLITLGVTMLSIEFLILYFKKKRRNWNKD